jgi:hypothetical protein
MSQLREIHDGEYRKDFGTGVTKIWRGRITIIAAVTPALDRYYSMSSTLGERFLQVRWHRPARVAGERAIDQQTSESNIRQEIIHAVQAVFNEASPDVPEISNAVRRQLAAIAELVAVGRTHVYRSNYGNREIEEVPESEANTRVSKGLAAIARGTAALCRQESVGDAVLRDAYRVALDCVPPLRKQILLAAIRQVPSPLKQSTTGERAREDLQELGLLIRDAPSPTLSAMAVELIGESRLREVLHMAFTS